MKRFLRVFFRMILNNRGEFDPNQQGTDQAAQDALESALGEAGVSAGDQPPPGEGTPPAEPTPPEPGKEETPPDKPGEAGGKKETKPAPAPDKKKDGKPEDDPEFEMDLGSKDKPDLKKVKLSELRKGYMLNADYTRKLEEVNKQREEMQDLINFANAVKSDKGLSRLILGITEKAITKDGMQSDFINKALDFLDGKLQVAEQRIEGQQDELEEMLKDIDPDSPVAKMVRTMHASNKNNLAVIEKLQNRLDSFEGNAKAEQERLVNENQEKLRDTAKQVLNDTLGGLVSAENTHGIAFESDAEKSVWRSLTIAHLRDNPKSFKDMDDFAKHIVEIGKSKFEELKKMGEAKLEKYIKSKATPPAPPDGASGGAGTKDEVLDMSDPAQFQNGLEQALKSVESS